MRLFTIGLILILLGMFILAVGLPLLSYISCGCHVSTGGFIWIFPFPVIAFGNIAHMSPLLYILSIVAFIAFIVFVILMIISYVRYRRGHEEYLEEE